MVAELVVWRHAVRHIHVRKRHLVHARILHWSIVDPPFELNCDISTLIGHPDYDVLVDEGALLVPVDDLCECSVPPCQSLSRSLRYTAD